MPTLRLKTSAIKCLHDVAISECMGLDNIVFHIENKKMTIRLKNYPNTVAFGLFSDVELDIDTTDPIDISMNTKDIRSVLDACKKIDMATFVIGEGFVTATAGNVKKKFPLTTGKMMEKFPNVPLTSKVFISSEQVSQIVSSIKPKEVDEHCAIKMNADGVTILHGDQMRSTEITFPTADVKDMEFHQDFSVKFPADGFISMFACSMIGNGVRVSTDKNMPLLLEYDTELGTAKLIIAPYVEN